MEYLLPKSSRTFTQFQLLCTQHYPSTHVTILSFQYTHTHTFWSLHHQSLPFRSSQRGEFSQSIEDIYLSDSSRACVQNLDCIVREMRKPASRILTLIRKRTNDLHIVFLRRRCPIIVTRMKFELSSCPAPIRNSTPAHSRFRFLRLVITSPLPPSSSFLPRSMSRSRCRVFRSSTLVVSNCVRERFRVAAVSTETFNREWNSRWNVNETQLDYTTITLFPGYSQSFAEIPGCFQRDEIPAWQTQRRFPPRSRTTNPNLSHVIFFLLLFSSFFLACTFSTFNLFDLSTQYEEFLVLWTRHWRLSAFDYFLFSHFFFIFFFLFLASKREYMEWTRIALVSNRQYALN